MTISHHLDDSTLMRYASGDLDEAFCIVAAAHLSLCPECRRSVRLADEIGAQLVDASEQAELTGGAFERLMLRIGGNGERIVAPRAGAVAGSDVPLPLQRFVGPSLEGISWRSVAPGIRKHAVTLPGSRTSTLFLLHIGPGKAMPEHGHGGSEMTLILSGAYRDEFGRFARGDVADLDEHVEHQPRVEPGEPCICVVATEAPTRFKGLLSRLLQPFVRI